MKTFISTTIIALFSCTPFVYAQQNTPSSFPEHPTITVKTHAETNEQKTSFLNKQTNYTVPSDAIEIQLSDIELIESDLKYSDDEKNAIQEEISEEYKLKKIQFKLSNESIIYVLFDEKCIDTFPITEKNGQQITAIINDDDAGDILLYQLKFTTK